jgi:hypothetical protein
LLASALPLSPGVTPFSIYFGDRKRIGPHISVTLLKG